MTFFTCARIACHVGSTLPVSFTRSTLKLTLTARLVSTSRVLFAEADKDLFKRLTDELDYEKNNTPAKPAFVSTFEKSGTFEIIDKPGQAEVNLVKRQDGQTVEDIANAETTFEDEDAGEEQAFPVITVITVTQDKKPNLGAITFHATCENGAFHIDNVTFSADPSLAVKNTAEADFTRRGQYIGPVFDDLDEKLQDGFYSYLKSRGIDQQLGEFIPAYVEYKEQAEYLRWLDNVRRFTEC